jgi:hypothetical protein
MSRERVQLGRLNCWVLVVIFDASTYTASEEAIRMKQLAIRGATLTTPALSEEDLKDVLGKLGVLAVFNDAEIHEAYFEIAKIYGSWMAEEESKQVSPVASALRSTGKNLIEASRLLNGRATGLRNQVEFEVTTLTTQILAQNPTVGGQDNAQQLVSTFQAEAERVGHACLIAYADLSRNAPNEGRSPLLWYDKFTALLFRIAEKAGVEPALNKDRIDQARGGWLFDAAQAIEPFLDPKMRSPSPEACGKRLERSRKRLLKAHRQNPNPR